MEDYSFPLKSWVMRRRFSRFLVTRVTLPSTLLPCLSLLCPQSNSQVGGMIFTDKQRFVKNVTIFGSKIRTDLSIRPHHAGPHLPTLCKSPWELTQSMSLGQSPLVFGPYPSAPCAHHPGSSDRLRSDSSTDSCQAWHRSLCQG